MIEIRTILLAEDGANDIELSLAALCESHLIAVETIGAFRAGVNEPPPAQDDTNV